MIEEVIQKKVVYRTNYTGDTSIIDSHNHHLCSFDKGRVISNRGGYQSNDITFGYQDLIAFIINSFSLINKKATLINFWLNINKGIDFNTPHIHNMNIFSAVYYHKVCCDKSPLVFSDLVPTVLNWTYPIFPKNQEIVLFDSTIPHSVAPCNNHNHERISIAFNFAIL